MRKIRKSDIMKLAQMEPENFVVIRINDAGFQILRMLDVKKDDLYGIRQYNDTYSTTKKPLQVSWGDYIACKTGFWECMNDIHSSLNESYHINNYASLSNMLENFMYYNHKFIDAPVPIRFYAITAMEFSDVAPLLRNGIYGFFVERRED